MSTHSSQPSSPTKSSPEKSSSTHSSRTESETSAFIHQRYEDTSLVIFRQEQKRQKYPANYLTLGESVKYQAYSSHGNASVIIKKTGSDVTKTDERPIRSQFCVIM